MNNLSKVLLAILAGIETTFSIFVPIIIAVIWVSVVGFDAWGSYLIYGVGLFATLFRAIKFLIPPNK